VALRSKRRWILLRMWRAICLTGSASTVMPSNSGCGDHEQVLVVVFVRGHRVVEVAGDDDPIADDHQLVVHLALLRTPFACEEAQRHTVSQWGRVAAESSGSARRGAFHDGNEAAENAGVVTFTLFGGTYATVIASWRGPRDA
jgi:hypothetical protein